jgi:hypothetical protein
MARRYADAALCRYARRASGLGPFLARARRRVPGPDGRRVLAVNVPGTREHAERLRLEAATAELVAFYKNPCPKEVRHGRR